MSARPLLPLVDECEEWGAIEWWRLEIRSLDDAPRAQRDLAVLAPKVAWSKEYGRPSVGGCLQSVAYVALIVLPLIAAIWMLGWSTSTETPMPLETVGVFACVCLAITIYSEVQFSLAPRAVARKALRAACLAVIIPGLVVLGVALGGVRDGHYDPHSDPPLWWLLPVGLLVLVHALIWIRGSTIKAGPQNPIENLEASIGELDDTMSASIRANRDEAIMRLFSRSKIDAETRDRALATDLGKLALALAPEGRSAYYSAAEERRHREARDRGDSAN